MMSENVNMFEFKVQTLACFKSMKNS